MENRTLSTDFEAARYQDQLIIKAISLHQPWASLIAALAKTIETRRWAPPYGIVGTQIAIHAAQQLVQLPNKTHRQHNEYVAHALGPNWHDSAPRGAVVAIATLQSAEQVDEFTKLPDNPELLFGDYSVGRWMWKLDDIVPLTTTYPCRGRQSFWNWPVPDEIRHLVNPTQEPQKPRQQKLQL